MKAPKAAKLRAKVGEPWVETRVCSEVYNLVTADTSFLKPNPNPATT